MTGNNESQATGNNRSFAAGSDNRRRRFSFSWMNDVMNAVNSDSLMAHRSKGFTTDLLVGFGDTEYLLVFSEGKLAEVQQGVGLTQAWDFALRGTNAAWTELLETEPSPGRQSIFALMKNGDLQIEGDLKRFMQHVWAILRFVELMRITPREGRNGQS